MGSRNLQDAMAPKKPFTTPDEWKASSAIGARRVARYPSVYAYGAHQVELVAILCGRCTCDIIRTHVRYRTREKYALTHPTRTVSL